MIDLTKRRIDVQSDGRNFVAQIYVWRSSIWDAEPKLAWREGEMPTGLMDSYQPKHRFKARTPEKAYAQALAAVRAAQTAELHELVRTTVIQTGSYSEVFDTSAMADDLLVRQLRTMYKGEDDG